MRRGLMRDLRQALRSQSETPGFVPVAVLSTVALAACRIPRASRRWRRCAMTDPRLVADRCIAVATPAARARRRAGMPFGDRLT